MNLSDILANRTRSWFAQIEFFEREVGVHPSNTFEQDIAAVEEFRPDLAIGTTPVVQHAKQLAIPSLYFTNLISARPLMGPAGAGSLAMVVNAAIGGKARMYRMSTFFEGVGSGHTTGIWEDTPQDRPSFKKKYAALNEAARKAAEAVGS